jgi:transcriptional regulator with XRE-family HTH domain
LAGLTRSELSEALDLSDQSLLEAVENGTATLSFELILRLAAVLARHDPVPFIIRFTRTYNPEIWGMLEKWGIGRIPVHFERERQFINIYRSQDTVRKLSDEGFQRVLHFTGAAFEMALHFISQQQTQEDPDVQDKKAKKR